MTARKPKTKVIGEIKPEHLGLTQEQFDAMHEAEHEQDVVSEANPTERITAEAVAWDLAESYKMATVDGNRLTITFPGPNGLVQTFHATVEEGIREF